MSSDAGQLDLTPLLDVVLIVLMFFIVSASTLHFDSVPLHLKQNNTTGEKTYPTVMITLHSDNAIRVSGRKVALNT